MIVSSHHQPSKLVVVVDARPVSRSSEAGFTCEKPGFCVVAVARCQGDRTGKLAGDYPHLTTVPR